MLAFLSCAILILGWFYGLPTYGEATWYNLPGQTMRGGDIYDPLDPTIAACGFGPYGRPAVPLGTKLKVCSKDACIKVVVQDTGLFPASDLDLSVAAFKKLAPLSKGRIPIKWRME